MVNKKCIVMVVLSALAIEAIGRPVIKATFTEVAPIIDGRIDDPCWKNASTISNFIQQEPDNGALATEQTVVYILADETNLYLGFDCFDSEPDEIVANITRRDKITDLLISPPKVFDDIIEIMIDPHHNRRDCYYFIVNPIGTQEDGIKVNEGAEGGNEWDGYWKSATSVSKDGWTVEVSIPFSILPFKEEVDTWGINFYRVVKRKLENSYWVNVEGNKYKVSQFGELTNLHIGKEKKKFTCIPSTFLNGEKNASTDWESNFGVGLALNYKITPELTTVFTLYPDYSQIEADQDQINLTKEVEITLPEKRPFFLEGFGLFKTPFELLYTRRIRDIDYGAKLVGKISDFDAGIFGIKAPTQKNYVAMRTKRGILASSDIGVTYVGKDSLDNYNRVLGFDSHINLGKKVSLMGQLARNWTNGVKGFNDAYYVKADYITPLVILSINYRDIGETFNPEVGYIEYIDVKGVKGGGILKLYPRRYGIARMSAVGNVTDLRNHEGEKMVSGIRPGITLLFQNKWSFIYGGEFEEHRLGNDYYNIKMHQLTFQYNPEEWNTFLLTYLFAPNYYWDTELKLYQVAFSWNLLGTISIDGGIIYQSLVWPEKTDNDWLIPITLHHQLTNKLSHRTFIQWSDQIERFDINFLLRYDFSPMSHIFFVWNEGRNNSEFQFGEYDMSNLPLERRGIFLKFVYQFQPTIIFLDRYKMRRS